MTVRPAFPATGSFAILDVETAPADEAIAIADCRRGDPGDRTALHSLTAGAVMRFDIGPGAAFSGLSLRSFDAGSGDEGDLVERLDGVLSTAHVKGAALITFNGLAHDLPVIERRAARHWLFSAGRYSAWRKGGDLHLDLMRDGVGAALGRWPSLVDCCAAFGVPATPVPCGPLDKLTGPRRKCEVDVAATFILFLYDLAARTGEIAPMLRGLDAFARHLASPTVRAPHLTPFARHPHVSSARRVLASLETA